MADSLSRWLSLPASLLLETGVFLVAYAAAVAFVAFRNPIPRSLAWVLAQAAVVVVLAELQWTALRRTQVPGWA